MGYMRLLLFRAECSNKNIWNLLSVTRRAFHETFQGSREYQSDGIYILDAIIPDDVFTMVDDSIPDKGKEILLIYNRMIDKTNPRTYFLENTVEYYPYMQYDVRIVYDLVYAENSETDKFEEMHDPVSLQYLLLILNRLSASKSLFKFDVFLSKATGSFGSPHFPLSYSDTIVRMRTFLLLCSQRTVFPEYAKLLNHFHVLYRYDNIEPLEWRPFFSATNAELYDHTESEPIGRIIPFIPINEETYAALQSEKESNSAALTLISIFEDYLERYVRLSDVFKELSSIKANATKGLNGYAWLSQYLDTDKIIALSESKEKIESKIEHSIILAISKGAIFLKEDNVKTFVKNTIEKTWDVFSLWLIDVNSSINWKQLWATLGKLKNNRVEQVVFLARELNLIVNQEINSNLDCLNEIKLKLSKTMHWKDEISADTILEKLLFMATLYYYALNEVGEKRNACFNEEKISLLHEICTDYAQGIFQLIENAWFHVIKSGSIESSGKYHGCGGLTIRIRKKEDIAKLLNEQKTSDNSSNLNCPIMDSRYYIEIYVTDLQYDLQRFRSVVQVFRDNVLRRAKNPSNHAAKRFCEGGDVNRIQLAHLFGDIEFAPLAEYLNDPANVAFHYGLQILSNVIETGNGYFLVRSGDGEENFFSSNNKFYKRQSLDWQNGTAYMIILPLNMEKHIDYQDALAVRNDTADQPMNRSLIIPVPIIDISTGSSSLEKIRAVNEVMKKLSDVIHNNKGSSIFVIDCSNYKKVLEYEVLAKGVFLCSADEKEKKPTFALVNVKNRHEVIKLFRQFALFYNRKGECNEIMNNAIFIVDNKAEIDVLLKGSISSIIKNMYLNQIYGGMDSRAMEIINHLGNRRG